MALERSAGRVDPLAAVSGSAYARAGGEIIWIGAGDIAMHPRAVVLDQAIRPGVVDLLLPGDVAPWRPAAMPEAGAAVAASQVRGCEALRRDVARLGEPRGFAAMLVGGTPAFPLDRAVARVRDLARAFRNDDADGVAAAALPLLGLGPGLTPSGDDLVGAALFSRQAMATSQRERARWNAVAARLIDACASRSHAIGAALFRDLASGETFAPLHGLAAALAGDAGRDAVVDVARALVRIGHSSGWDMLAGFVIGATGSATPAALLHGRGDPSIAHGNAD